MSISDLTLNMQISGGALVPERLADVVAAVGEVFVPFEVSFHIDNEHTRLARNTTSTLHGSYLWVGEQLGAEPLTHCSPEPGYDLVRELRECLGGRTGTTAWLRATGALRHRAGHATPEWYGRWASPGDLRELVELRVAWLDGLDDIREFEMRFPLNGYPLMPVSLPHDYPLEEGSAELAAENRALVLPALTRVRGALGLTSEQVAWSVQGRTWRHPDIVAEIENTWLPRFR